MAAEIKYIVAGTYSEYKRYVARKLAEGASASQYRYVDSVNTLRGLSECHGYFIGTYQQRPDIDEIRDAIRIVNNTRAPQTVTKIITQLPSTATTTAGTITIASATSTPENTLNYINIDTPKLGDLKLHDGKFYAWYGDYDGWQQVSAVEQEAYRELRAGQNPS